MKIKKQSRLSKFFSTSLIALTFSSLAGAVENSVDIPNFTCHLSKVLQVNPNDLSTVSYDSSDVYKILNGRLYISNGNNPEYFYNKVIRLEPMRYSSGYKMIHIKENGSKKYLAQITHVYIDEVRVATATCIKID